MYIHVCSGKSFDLERSYDQINIEMPLQERVFTGTQKLHQANSKSEVYIHVHVLLKATRRSDKQTVLGSGKTSWTGSYGL